MLVRIRIKSKPIKATFFKDCIKLEISPVLLEESNRIILASLYNRIRSQILIKRGQYRRWYLEHRPVLILIKKRPLMVGLLKM